MTKVDRTYPPGSELKETVFYAVGMVLALLVTALVFRWVWEAMIS